MGGPLHGLKVIEMTGMGPGPLGGQLLADLGAEVTAIDRISGPRVKQDVNRRGKKSVSLNLKTPDGLDVARRLIAQADVLIEGFRPGVMEKLGLGPDRCCGENPRLIFGRITGWGQDGPLAQTAGHDINYLSLTGMLGAMGAQGEPPFPPLNLVADYGGGTMFLLLGILAALFERDRSGSGQVVDAAMIDGVSAFTGLLQMMRASGQWTDQRQSNILDGAAPYYRCYETLDGKYIAVGCIEPQFYAEFLRLAGLPADYAANQNDRSVWTERCREFEALFRGKTRASWMQIFEGSDACVSAVLEVHELGQHRHATARGMFIELDGVHQAAPAPRFDRTPPSMPSAPTAPGADADRVLSENGFSSSEIARLRQVGALA